MSEWHIYYVNYYSVIGIINKLLINEYEIGHNILLYIYKTDTRTKTFLFILENCKNSSRDQFSF